MVNDFVASKLMCWGSEVKNIPNVHDFIYWQTLGNINEILILQFLCQYFRYPESGTCSSAEKKCPIDLNLIRQKRIELHIGSAWIFLIGCIFSIQLKISTISMARALCWRCSKHMLMELKKPFYHFLSFFFFFSLSICLSLSICFFYFTFGSLFIWS